MAAMMGSALVFLCLVILSSPLPFSNSVKYANRVRFAGRRLGRKQRCMHVISSAAPSEVKKSQEAIKVPGEVRSELEPVLLNRSLTFDEKMTYLDDYFSKRPTAVARRLGTILSRIARVAAVWTLDKSEPEVAPTPPGCAFEPDPDSEVCEHNETEMERKRARVLRDSIASTGVLFIKLAQTAATRPDLIGDEAARALEKLQDRTQPFADIQAKRILLEDIGDDVFSEITDSPIAAASLAQVYKATLKGTGETVAVKVRRPGLVDQVALDSYLTRLILRQYTSFFAGAERDYEKLFNEVGSGLLEELDFQKEAENANDFREAHKHVKFLRVPESVPGLVTPRVLTLEWIEGRKLTNLPLKDQRRMVKMGIDICFQQLLRTGVVHADPHYGNMLYDNDGNLALLDFGLVTRVTQSQKEAMAGSIVHTLQEDWEGLIDDYRELGLLPTQPAIWVDNNGNAQDGLAQGIWMSVTQEQFVTAFRNRLEGDDEPNSELTNEGKEKRKRTFSEITSRLTELSFQYRFTLPEWMLFIIRSVITLDGFAGRMNPPFNALELAYPHAVRRALTPKTRKGQQDLLKLILTKDGDLSFERLSELFGDLSRVSASANRGTDAKSVDAENEGLTIGVSANDMKELIAGPEGIAMRRLLYQLNTQRMLSRILAILSPLKTSENSEIPMQKEMRSIALDTLRQQIFKKNRQKPLSLSENMHVNTQSRMAGGMTVGATGIAEDTGVLQDSEHVKERKIKRRLRKILRVIGFAHARRCLSSPKSLLSAMAIVAILSVEVLRSVFAESVKSWRNGFSNRLAGRRRQVPALA